MVVLVQSLRDIRINRKPDTNDAPLTKAGTRNNRIEAGRKSTIISMYIFITGGY